MYKTVDITKQGKSIDISVNGNRLESDAARWSARSDGDVIVFTSDKDESFSCCYDGITIDGAAAGSTSVEAVHALNEFLGVFLSSGGGGGSSAAASVLNVRDGSPLRFWMGNATAIPSSEEMEDGVVYLGFSVT